MPTKILVNTDGAAKGNPGPAGIGVALYRPGDPENAPLATVAEYIGETTNNVAEYKALLRGLSEALLRGADQVEVRTDSELMARQVEGRYKVNSPPLIPLHAEARRLLARFAQARIVHVPRGQNTIADKLANQGIAEAREAAKAPKLAKPQQQTPPEPTFAHTYSTEANGEKIIYNVERLWELAKSLPVKTIPLERVAGILDEDCWFCGTPPTLRRVANHAKRIYEADFSHPIILNASGDLVDGGHRIARAWLEGRTEIQAVQFESDPEPDARLPLR